MAIQRLEVVSRHNPKLNAVDISSPLSVGNGDFAYTADVTGMQTLYKLYKNNHVPLCTMSNWGWHTTPVNKEIYGYTLDDLSMTEYDYHGRKVSYAVEPAVGNEEVYHWLRQNPHRMNLGRIGLIFKEKELEEDALSHIQQELFLYEGRLESSFCVNGTPCQVTTLCSQKEDVLGFKIQSSDLSNGRLSIILEFPYGSPDISASDWNRTDRHQSILKIEDKGFEIHRILDKDNYFVTCRSDQTLKLKKENHKIIISTTEEVLEFTVAFTERSVEDFKYSFVNVYNSSLCHWRGFWEKGGIVDLHKSKDERAVELERRIVLSQYLSAIQSCGSIPPQETGLTCNSWYGKFHLEMHPWHCAYLPLWNHTEMLERSLPWYQSVLSKAKENASRNQYKGARWPKMVASDGIDSPSVIATLLIWQQPHIIYLLELAYQSKQENRFLQDYWEIVKESADFMVDFVVWNPKTNQYDLEPPIIPAQEEHAPRETKNPTFEIEYWRFALNIAARWAKRLGKPDEKWEHTANHMAELPVKGGRYLAHENCPLTFESFNKDHPSMLGAFGFLPSDRVVPELMQNTLDQVVACWKFDTMWGWDFAMMAMTAVRLHNPELAIDLLLMDTPKNSYVASGNNFQKLRKDLPLYLPGNGSLLLAIPMMIKGTPDCKEELPGFPKNGLWEVEYENIMGFPY